ncbi:MAG: heat shock protein HspQ [Planctomycetes bacterium]|nr:heat shock protein HspQ [Planctomycetota bacterium]
MESLPGPRKFDPGQVIQHKRYGYRGVIVAFDTCCQADEQWYHKNQSQPDRDQPWYHVLVDQATHHTYVAQSNLELEPSGDPVSHPYIEHFFDAYENKCYVRNDRQWPG